MSVLVVEVYSQITSL